MCVVSAGWSMACAARGMCRLPGVFVAPTQALLLAALAALAPEPRADADAGHADVLPRAPGALLGVAA